MATKFLDETGLKHVLTNLNNNFPTILNTTLNYETGVFEQSGEVWWVNTTSDPLQYKPYRILNGTYETIGSYCTITAKVEKVEGWVDIYVSLPFTPLETASTTAVDNEGIIYNIITTTQSDDNNVAHPVVGISRQDRKGMERGDNDHPNSYIEFTLKYKYR